MKQIGLVAAAAALIVLAAYNGESNSSAERDGTPAPIEGEGQEYKRDKCIENCG